MNVTVTYGTDERTSTVEQGTVLGDAIIATGLPLEQPCAGRGSCLKCKVIAEGTLSPLDEKELEGLTEAEQAADYRLACRARVLGTVEVTLAPIVVYSNKIFRACDDYKDKDVPLGLAIDLGSTTVAAFVTTLDTGRVCLGAAALNQQTAFGADVISRMAAALTGPETAQRLSMLALSSIVQAIDALRLPRRVKERIQKVTIVGNCVMHHLLLQYPVATLADTGPTDRYVERIAANGEDAEPFNLVRLNDVKTGTPWLADTVDDSFLGWRYELRNEVGYDFLGELSDAARDVASYTDTSQYASWHKSGRAIDTLFDYYLGEQLAHEIVREDYSGETYWRVYLRCVDQSGRCGQPVVANPWNYSARARTDVAPEQGGIEKPIPSGYYVDMTALAGEFGWDRISSYDDEEYGWTWHFLAFEYWHYQKRLEDNSAAVTGKKQGNGAPNWYRAMRDIYPQETLDRYFTWEKLRAMNEDPHLIALKGVPLPLEFKPWWTLVEQAQ